MFVMLKTLRLAVPIKAQVGKSNQQEKWTMDFYNFLWWEIKYDRTFS